MDVGVCVCERERGEGRRDILLLVFLGGGEG